jgi:predicted phosphoribosyltransferase
MALNLEAKKVVVKQVNALAKGSISVGWQVCNALKFTCFYKIT